MVWSWFKVYRAASLNAFFPSQCGLIQSKESSPGSEYSNFHFFFFFEEEECKSVGRMWKHKEQFCEDIHKLKLKEGVLTCEHDCSPTSVHLVVAAVSAFFMWQTFVFSLRCEPFTDVLNELGSCRPTAGLHLTTSVCSTWPDDPPPTRSGSSLCADISKILLV